MALPWHRTPEKAAEAYGRAKKEYEACGEVDGPEYEEAREFSFQGKFPAVKFTPERKFMPPLSGDIGRTKASDIPVIPIRGTIRGTVASLPRSHAR